VPHYFFNANGPGQAIGDSDGKRLWDLEAARRIALETARDLVRDAALQWEDWSFQITGEDGQTLLLVPFSDALVKH
jgi:hypothetical protein